MRQHGIIVNIKEQFVSVALPGNFLTELDHHTLALACMDKPSKLPLHLCLISSRHILQLAWQTQLILLVLIVEEDSFVMLTRLINTFLELALLHVQPSHGFVWIDPPDILHYFLVENNKGIGACIFATIHILENIHTIKVAKHVLFCDVRRERQVTAIHSNLIGKRTTQVLPAPSKILVPNSLQEVSFMVGERSYLTLLHHTRRNDSTLLQLDTLDNVGLIKTDHTSGRLSASMLRLWRPYSFKLGTLRRTSLCQSQVQLVDTATQFPVKVRYSIKRSLNPIIVQGTWPNLFTPRSYD